MNRDEQTPEGGIPSGGSDPVLLGDPVTDALMRMLVELSAQVWIERERRLALEELLVGEGKLQPGQLEAFQPSAAAQARIRQERDRYVQDLFGELRRLTR